MLTRKSNPVNQKWLYENEKFIDQELLIITTEAKPFLMYQCISIRKPLIMKRNELLLTVSLAGFKKLLKPDILLPLI